MFSHLFVIRSHLIIKRVKLLEVFNAITIYFIKVWSYNASSDWLSSRFASGYVNTVIAYHGLKEIENGRFLLT